MLEQRWGYNLKGPKNNQKIARVRRGILTQGGGLGSVPAEWSVLRRTEDGTRQDGTRRTEDGTFIPAYQVPSSVRPPAWTEKFRPRPELIFR